ncbi:MAG TPA: DUF6188 family protein [Terriglobales bacterium]|nr:DUF6188 family protein [Terriglobales bacterium]
MSEVTNKLLHVLAGRRVTQLKVDFGFTVSLWSPDLYVEIRIEQPFTFTSRDGRRYHVRPDDIETVCAALQIFNQVASGAAVDNGALRVEFESKLSFFVSPHQKYEAWTIAASNGLKIVCAPGGELAVWSPPHR